MAVISYKCPNCGGDLRFDPATQGYKCEYCMSSFSQAELEQANPEKEQPKASEAEPVSEAAPAEGASAILYSCPSCGAEIVTDATTAATFCYYCHNPVVLQGRLEGAYLPDSILPFQVDRAEAEKVFLEYVKKKKFVPQAFFNKAQIEKLSGIYFPYWVCDEKLDGELQASATKVRTWRMGDTEYTETKFYEVARAGQIEIKELTKNALKKANRKLIEGVQPFPLKEAKEFTMGYLSGFQAEKRDLEKQDLKEEVQQEVKKYAQDLMKDSISGYTAVSTKHLNLRSEEGIWNYVLLPVWTLTYKGRDAKVYYYAMNGITRKICGEFPLDYKKVAILFAAVAVPIWILFLIGGYFL